MPRELRLLSPQRFEIVENETQPLKPDEVSIKTCFTRLCHGWDCFISRSLSLDSFPHRLTTWGVGQVIATGKSVLHFSAGDWVYGPMCHADIQRTSADVLRPLRDLKKEFSVFIGAGINSLRCIHQTHLRYGDRILIFGLGTLGLMALQFALFSGAREIVAVDSIDTRLQIARRLGAHQIVHSNCQEYLPDIDLNKIDHFVDCSGNPESLLRLIRFIHPQTRLTIGCSIYSTDIIDRVCSECGEKQVPVSVSYPMLDNQRLSDIVRFSIVNKRVIVWPIISHYISFDDTPCIYEKIQANPDEYRQVIVNYD